MSDLATTNGWTTAGTAEAVSLPRRHLLALAILVCVPLPALSLAATVIPLPQMLERVTAAFSNLAPPALGGGESVIRESNVAVGALKITYDPSELRRGTTTAKGLQGANGAAPRATPARGGFGATKPGAGDRSATETYQVDPGTETNDRPVDPGTDGGTTDSGDVPTGPKDPTGTPSTPEPKADPPSPTPPGGPQTGGSGGGSGGSGGGGNSGGGGSSGGSGGGGNSGGSGGSGGGPNDPPAGGTPPDPGGGRPPDSGKGTPGSGSGSDPTPPGNGPPAPGDRGKP